MALIKCPECGKSISSLAEKCPECGYPLAKYIDSLDGMIAVYDKRWSNDNGFFVFTKIDNFDADDVEVIGSIHQLGGDYFHQTKYYSFISKIDEKELITDEKGFKYVSTKYPKRVVNCHFLTEYLSEKHKYSNEIKLNNDTIKISDEFRVGNIVEFGNYQGEKLTWIVVNVDFMRKYATLLSYKIIDFMQYDINEGSEKTDFRQQFSYLNSSIRKWLITEFYNSSFSPEEREKFISIKQRTNGYLNEEISDVIFLPHSEEVKGYLNEKIIQRACPYSEYAYKKLHDFCYGGKLDKKDKEWFYERYLGTWFLSDLSFDRLLHAKLINFFKCDTFPFDTYTPDRRGGVRPEINIKIE